MPPEAPAASNQQLPKGLPAVVPPSGKFIVQLFFVPFIIVTAVVCFLLAFNWLVGSGHSPEQFLRKLDDPNPDIRWRGAEDLAQVLLRDEVLASNPKFALDLTDRLRQALQTNSADEKALAERLYQQPKGEFDKHARWLDPGRDHALYLSACLGNLMVPVGAPLLGEMALSQDGSDARVVARQRWRAVWVLANLGENVKRFDKLPPARKESVRAELGVEADGTSERAHWASAALKYLNPLQSRCLQDLGVDKALLQCAEDPNPFLREITAFALNFWDGSPEENARIEERLVKLSFDDGRGEEMLEQLRDEDDKADGIITKTPGLKIRYNATVALARRGSDNVRLGLLQEMLDESVQKENFRLRPKTGPEVPDEATATLTLVTALQAVAELHRKRPEPDLSTLYSALDQLGQAANAAVRNEAERTLIALGRR
jgi:hypothetical protein